MIEHRDADEIQVLGQFGGERVEVILDRDDDRTVHDQGNELIFECVQGRIGDLGREGCEKCRRLDGDRIELSENRIGQNFDQIGGDTRPRGADVSVGHLGVEEILPACLLAEWVGPLLVRGIEEVTLKNSELGRSFFERGLEKFVDALQSALENRHFPNGCTQFLVGLAEVRVLDGRRSVQLVQKGVDLGAEAINRGIDFRQKRLRFDQGVAQIVIRAEFIDPGLQLGDASRGVAGQFANCLLGLAEGTQIHAGDPGQARDGGEVELLEFVFHIDDSALDVIDAAEDRIGIRIARCEFIRVIERDFGLGDRAGHRGKDLGLLAANFFDDGDRLFDALLLEIVAGGLDQIEGGNDGLQALLDTLDSGGIDRRIGAIDGSDEVFQDVRVCVVDGQNRRIHRI